MILVTAAQLSKLGLAPATTEDGSLCLSAQGFGALCSGYYPACHYDGAIADDATGIRHHVRVAGDPHSLEVFVDVWGPQLRARKWKAAELRARLRGQVEREGYIERRARLRAARLVSPVA